MRMTGDMLSAFLRRCNVVVRHSSRFEKRSWRTKPMEDDLFVDFMFYWLWSAKSYVKGGIRYISDALFEGWASAEMFQ